jgi:SAM-dependent methyltransferase
MTIWSEVWHSLTSREVDRMQVSAMRARIDVLKLADSFFESSVLFALAKLRIFELIGEGDKSLDELAAELGARPDTLARLLNAGIVLKLLETQDGLIYRVSPTSRSVLLPSAGEAYLGDWIRNLSYLNLALTKLDEAVLRSGPTIDPLAHLGADRDRTREFALAMHNYAALSGKELAHYLPTTGCTSLLDLGCGPGTYAFHLGMSNADLQLYLLDSPGVLQVAREVQARYSLKNEVHYLPADALRDEIPGSYDIILVSNTLHQLGHEASSALIKRLYGSVNPGGSLVIQARFLREDRTGERVPVFLDLLELCITSAGKNHSVAETTRWLEQAGFSDVEFCAMSFFNENSFLRGYKK